MCAVSGCAVSGRQAGGKRADGERETRLELATTYLEGRRSTN
jgi:hypothetical protein